MNDISKIIHYFKEEGITVTPNQITPIKYEEHYYTVKGEDWISDVFVSDDGIIILPT